MDEDEEDFIFYGTPIEREEDTSHRKRKAVSEAGQLRSLPPWKQEVRDDEGRRRFHGAFTGGFSAGYYNTAGSKEGWTPQTFTSSRKNRAEVKQQSIYSFLDDDEKVELEGRALETSLQFDTFGFTATELARRQAEKEQQKRPSAIPGPVPDEIVLPATNSIGVKLLLKMGWRHGHSIENAHTAASYDARREARKAFLALSGNDVRSELDKLEPSKVDSENFSERCSDGNHSVDGSRSTPVFVLNPKQDLCGLGYDPFKQAPEFRERKNLVSSRNKDWATRKSAAVKGGLFASNSGRLAPGFGIGALEELDVEDEDIYASGFECEESYVHEVEQQPSRIDSDSKLRLHHKEHNHLPGFKIALNSDYNVERFRPPVILPGFQPHHKFPAPLQFPMKFIDLPPPEVPAPEENDLKLLIDGFATLVSRCGKLFEDLSREKNKTNPMFSFLRGGKGHDYYVRKLWEEQHKHVDQKKLQMDADSVSYTQKMTAEGRGRILGEKPLERSVTSSSSSLAPNVIHLQSNLSDTFTKPVSIVGLSESEKPFRDDPAKQERFEQFVKDKYQGGLRSTYSGSSSMTEVERAREKLDFEAAAEAIAKGENAKIPVLKVSLTSRSQFVSGGMEEEKTEKKTYPKREEFQWRPSPILCKRFDIIDPFTGKPPPLPRARSKMDSLIFLPDSKTLKIEAGTTKDFSVPPQSEIWDHKDQAVTPETDSQTNETVTERPVDLYKAIFSDDSDDDGDNSVANPVNDSEKKVEGANLTLNRLIAGDFLESLGKELGLEVPETPYSSKNPDTAHKEAVVGDSSRNEISTSTVKTSDATMTPLEITTGESALPSGQAMGKNMDSQNVYAAVAEVKDRRSHDTHNGILCEDYSFGAGASAYSPQKTSVVRMEKMEQQSTRQRTRTSRHRSRSSSSDSDSSDDRKHRRHRRSKADDHSSSDTESSGDGRCDQSRSKRKKRSVPHRSSKHSKRHKHRSRQPPARESTHGTGRDHSGNRRDNRTSGQVYTSKSDGHRSRH